MTIPYSWVKTVIHSPSAKHVSNGTFGGSNDICSKNSGQIVIAKYPVMPWPWNATPPLHKAHQSQVINMNFQANLTSTLDCSLLLSNSHSLLKWYGKTPHPIEGMEKRTNLEYNGIKLPSSSAVAMRPAAEMMRNGRTFVSTCQQDPPTNPSLAPASRARIQDGQVSDVNWWFPLEVFFYVFLPQVGRGKS